jgi:hypothetical protein
MLLIANEKLQWYISSGHITLKNFDFSKGFLAETFDRVLITFYTVNYLLDEDLAVRFLSNIRKSMNKNGLVLIDAFYPQPLQKPESAGLWHEKEITMDGSQIKLRDKRTLSGNIEERTQQFIALNSDQAIITHRRYYSKQNLFMMLDKSGFSSIEFTDGYDINGFDRLANREAVVSNFVAKAINK